MLMRRSDAFRCAVALLLGVALLACGPSPEQARAARAKQQQERQAHAAAASADPGGDADMVNAASPGGPGPPISLKFSLGGRPIVGEPLQIHIVLLPDTPNAIRYLYGTFSPGEGLALQSAHSFELRDPADGVPLRQEVTVVPQQAGILSVTTTLIIDFDTGSVSRIFGIPLIAMAASASTDAAAAAPAPGSATGAALTANPATVAARPTR